MVLHCFQKVFEGTWQPLLHLTAPFFLMTVAYSDSLLQTNAIPQKPMAFLSKNKDLVIFWHFMELFHFLRFSISKVKFIICLYSLPSNNSINLTKNEKNYASQLLDRNIFSVWYFHFDWSFSTRNQKILIVEIYLCLNSQGWNIVLGKYRAALEEEGVRNESKKVNVVVCHLVFLRFIL